MPRIVQQVKFPPVVPKRIRVAAYARVSNGKDAMLHSLASQVEYYSHYIRSTPGWEYAGVYADEAKTGANDSRENFQRMLTDCSPTAAPGKSTTSSPSPSPGSPGTP